MKHAGSSTRSTTVSYFFLTGQTTFVRHFDGSGSMPGSVQYSSQAAPRSTRPRSSTKANPAKSASARDAALADYDAAIAADPSLAAAWYNRALLRERRARLAHLSMAFADARDERARARADADEALARAPNDHPWRPRFEILADQPP